MTDNDNVEDEAIDAIVEAITTKAELSEKRAKFVTEYVIDWNMTQAAKRAGYAEGSARQQGQRLMSNVVIAKCVRDVKRARAKALGSEAEDIIAFHAGVLHDPHASTADKDRASDKLSKLHGYYITKVQVSGKDDGPVEVAVSPSEKLKTMLDALAERNAD